MTSKRNRLSIWGAITFIALSISCQTKIEQHQDPEPITFLRTGPWTPALKVDALDISPQLKQMLDEGNLRAALNRISHEESSDSELITIDLLYHLGRWQDALKTIEKPHDKSPSLDIYRFILYDAAGMNSKALELSKKLNINKDKKLFFDGWTKALQKLESLNQKGSIIDSPLLNLHATQGSPELDKLAPQINEFILKSSDFCGLRNAPKISLVATSNQQDFDHVIWLPSDKTIQSLFGTVDISRVWLYIPKGKAPNQDSLKSLVFHEMAHIISWRLTGINPKAQWWVTEGFAEYLSHKGLGYKPSVKSTAKDLKKLLSKIDSPHPFCKSDHSLQLQYSQALDLFLILEKTYGTEKLIRFMHFFSQGLNTSQAFRAAFKNTQKEFMERLED